MIKLKKEDPGIRIVLLLYDLISVYPELSDILIRPGLACWKRDTFSLRFLLPVTNIFKNSIRIVLEFSSI